MGLKLGGVDYGRAWCSAGARNFFGDGWPHHRWLGPLAPDFRGSTLVAKTTTLEAREGNMPLRGTTPREIRPRCIKINFRQAAVLNAVGLSGPGSMNLLASGRWRTRLDPFVISFMATGNTQQRRMDEATAFGRQLADARPHFLASFAVELNLSCPNVTHPEYPAAESVALLSALGEYLPCVPLIPKFSILTGPGHVAAVVETPYCAAICVSNTVPWGALPDRIDWRGLFGDVSPLAHLGGGGLSGAPLTTLVREWAADYLSRPHAAPLVAGGGVMCPGDATALLDLGAAAVEVGSVAIVRPWRVRVIVDAINRWQQKGG